MTRDLILQDILDIPNKNIVLELPTGFGKSRLALEKIKSLPNIKTLLIVHAKVVHKQTWKDEITKWWPDCPLEITYTTYVSVTKHIGSYDVILLDEAHHLSDRCQSYLDKYTSTYNIFLSATLNNSVTEKIKFHYPDTYFYKKSLRDAIDNSILPDPKVYLIKLKLDGVYNSEVITRHSKGNKQLITCTYKERFTYLRDHKDNPIKILCTEQQYYKQLSDDIDFWKGKFMRNPDNLLYKNKWLQRCNERLIWLSNKKIRFTQEILDHLKDYRTLTFCNNIEQTKILGEYCINSKNKNSKEYLKDFNEGKIDHITACNVLNEGVNLFNCQVGIYNNLNSSDIIIKQRAGRLLRHPNPIIIIPYFTNTRDEELLNKMLKNYNKDFIIRKEYGVQN